MGLSRSFNSPYSTAKRGLELGVGERHKLP